MPTTAHRQALGRRWLPAAGPPGPLQVHAADPIAPSDGDARSDVLDLASSSLDTIGGRSVDPNGGHWTISAAQGPTTGTVLAEQLHAALGVRHNVGAAAAPARPLTIGRPPRLLAKELLEAVDAVRTSGPAPQDAIVGQPASPGRATGPVRLLHGPGDFDRFQAGEVLVARATAPAWTPLFAHTVAVVADGGTLAAHASLVAREYGIPAVVATGDATAHLVDGHVVTVDGGAGTVHPDH